MLSFRSSSFHLGSRPRAALKLKISERWREFIVGNWHLGFTAFGGPPVHFQIFHTRFVDKLKWIDEQMYQELFALCQALPGPASTKMLFCINSIHGGIPSGLLAFCIWSFPGALGMYGLSVGVANIGERMPSPVYALLSGLNAATVGIIALAAVQLSEKAITDQMTRVLVFVGGAVGMLYSALWFFPVLMVAGGITAVVWDYRWIHKLARSFKRPRRPAGAESSAEIEISGPQADDAADKADTGASSSGLVAAESGLRRRDQDVILPVSNQDVSTSPSPPPTAAPAPAPSEKTLITWRMGVLVIAGFFATFITVIALRGTLLTPPRGYSLFANLYLAGTIIFGGGPVVIPLLREYIVNEGWVSSRDFLLGLALIQAFPGPNFNFAVYLGSLAVTNSALPKEAGALIAFLGIFAPGLILAAGIMGLWKVMRKRRWVISLLRGVNASATGLVFTAVYRLFQTGAIDKDHSTGTALGVDPFWVAVTATSFVGGRWFGLEPFFAILLGGALGMIWAAVAGVPSAEISSRAQQSRHSDCAPTNNSGQDDPENLAGDTVP
ncbi:hypothetical protein Dda_3668 [Drechslerella dactyloides]|uniref:Chromate transporter n=1 Tax=Drechslerella dactyloides TaxID=74499 RepID=A0AAD6IYD4_DREDA|nr:hypothetical protein Dda_3668 [Drechslerella dactyloides]